MQKKKIIFVHNNMITGGTAKNLANLLNELHDLYDITLVLFKASGEYMTLIPKDIKIIELKSRFRHIALPQAKTKGISYFIRGLYAYIAKKHGNAGVIKHILKSQKVLGGEYDYAICGVHNFDDKSVYIGCPEFTLYKIKAREKITYIHCDYLNSNVATKRNNRLYESMDKIFVPNKSCYNNFLSVIPNAIGKLHIIANFCNYQEVIEKSLINSVEYKKDVVNLVTVARLSKEKGIDRALNALMTLKEEGFTFNYHIVGDGPMREALIKQCEDLKLSSRVFLYGNQSNPFKYYKNADLHLLPSIHEAAGLVIDEARVLNVPTLTTKTVAAEELINENQCGWVCENSEKGLYEGLKRILQDTNILKEKKEFLQTLKCDNEKPKQQFINALNEV